MNLRHSLLKPWRAAQRVGSAVRLRWSPTSSIGLVFLLLFCLLTLLRARLPAHSLADSRWLIAVAALTVLPALLDHLGLKLKGLKIPGIAEISFQQAVRLEGSTEKIGIDELSAPQTVLEMKVPTYYLEVAKAAILVVESRAEVLMLDLGTGQTWWFSRLLVLGLILRRSRVSTVAFVEGPAEAPAFVGTCTLENLLVNLDSQMPKFSEAARRVIDSAAPNPQSLPVAVMELALEPISKLENEWVEGGTLPMRLPGLVLENGTLEWRGTLMPPDVHTVLASSQRFWGVTRMGHLWSPMEREFLIDRNKLALVVARQLTGLTS